MIPMNARRLNLTIVTRFLCCLSVTLSGSSANNDDTPRRDTSGNGVPDLKLSGIGEVRVLHGHKGAFRTYIATDGTDGRIVYASFPSLSEAHQQIEAWLKLATKIKSRKVNNNTQTSTERTVAFRRASHSSKGEVMIIRRDGLNCYLIESLSLRVATQVEGMIDHK